MESHKHQDSAILSDNIEELIELIMSAKEQLARADLASHQKDYINTTLSSLHVLIKSLQSQYSQFPGQLYRNFHRLITNFHSLISQPGNSSHSFIIDDTSHQLDTPMRQHKFSTPIKNSFSRSSSISKATITKETVLREPIHIDGNNFRRFTTPGIDNQFKHSITEVLRMSSPVRNDDDYSKSFESNNVFLD